MKKQLKKMNRRGLRAVFPGSFDPITKGHADIVRRSLNLFDEVVVGVLHNPSKTTLLSVDERIKLIEEEFADCGKRVVAASFSGLLVDFVHNVRGSAIIRGLRAISDYDYEAQMALMNKNMADEIETVFLMTSSKHSYVSSSLARQVAQFGGDVSALVSPQVEKALRAKFGTKVRTRRASK